MNREIKILHIIDTLGLGGAQTVVKGIFEYQRDNQNIFLFALRKKSTTFSVFHPSVFIENSFQKYSFGPLFELRILIKKEKINVLHCHLFRAQIFGLLLKIIWFKDIKLIFHEHGQIFLGSFIYNLFINLSKRYVDKIIAVSKATKEKLMFEATVSEDKITVLYNFVDLEKFSRKNITWNINEERKRMNIGKDEFVIGFAGRLAKVKGCEYLIKALPYLNFLHKVLIIGDGPEMNNLKVLVKDLKVNDRVIFLGYQENVLFVYSLLNALVIPSIFESFGLSAIEAQALAIPVVASGVGGLSEIIIDEENGLLFESQNEKDLYRKIKLLYQDNQLRQRLIKSGLEDVKKYNLVSYITNLNQIYENI